MKLHTGYRHRQGTTDRLDHSTDAYRQQASMHPNVHMQACLLRVSAYILFGIPSTLHIRAAVLASLRVTNTSHLDIRVNTSTLISRTRFYPSRASGPLQSHYQSSIIIPSPKSTSRSSFAYSQASNTRYSLLRYRYPCTHHGRSQRS